MDSHILVCGGAGYIGSHMVRMLREQGFHPLVLDDFSTGHTAALEGAAQVRCSLLDAAGLDAVFAGHSISAVMHFAAKSIVGESVRDPLPYYINNVGGTLLLLQAMRKANVDRIVFSSTAAVYGFPGDAPLTEDSPLAPVNPYGVTKKQAEEALGACAAAYGLRSVALRYFNAAGAHSGGGLGEAHNPETHLIPNMLAAVLGTGPALQLFGDDYDTPDGTCIRDYIHVEDLCRAHLHALAFLNDHEGAFAFNLGNGKGFSVKEVLAAAQRVTGRPVPHSIAPRRAGDPPKLVAVSDKARQQLGWQPHVTDLENIMETAWCWHQSPKY